MNLEILSAWEQCYNEHVALLCDSSPFFLSRFGGSDTDAVVDYLYFTSDHSESGRLDVFRHKERVMHLNGYYDRDNSDETFLRYLQAMLDTYVRSERSYFCNQQLLSLYFPNNIHPQFLLDVVPNRDRYEALVRTASGKPEGLKAYPYPFVEKLVSHRWTLFQAFSQCLPGKRVLVVTPFAASIEKNFEKRHGFFRKYDYPDFTPVLYNTPITYAGLSPDFYPDRDWFETCERMQEEISRLDFDIALMSCGSYAMPLGVFIHEKLQKQAIYVGGVLQLYFGIMGRRYENIFFTDQMNIENFIYPVERDAFLKHIRISETTSTEAFGAYF